MRILVAALLLSSLLAGCSLKAPRDPGAVDLPNGTGGILGNVVQGNGNQVPVENVTVIVRDLNLVASTGPDGKFVFRGVPPGNYTAVAYKQGYEGEPETFKVEADQYVEIVFFLDKLR